MSAYSKGNMNEMTKTSVVIRNARALSDHAYDTFGRAIVIRFPHPYPENGVVGEEGAITMRNHESQPRKTQEGKEVNNKKSYIEQIAIFYAKGSTCQMVLNTTGEKTLWKEKEVFI
ncbi:hypothetical protein NPIL_175591 [Nephila pilipes]|uniref:Uncharacterized protein n=1 Tax=Nephila pilipes TaxID=299642 RepID=A0A8X6QP59_NEPPI|nr:hypothetical protein NPIL_175591 [Nephila pilipes]